MLTELPMAASEPQTPSSPIPLTPGCSPFVIDAGQIRVAVVADLGLSHAPSLGLRTKIASGAVRVVLANYSPGARGASAPSTSPAATCSPRFGFRHPLVETLRAVRPEGHWAESCRKSSATHRQSGTNFGAEIVDETVVLDGLDGGAATHLAADDFGNPTDLT